MARDTRQWPQTITWSNGASAMLTNDGCLQVATDTLPLLAFHHLLSALDHDDGNMDGGQTTLSGYTEWISSNPALASLGWDWLLETGETFTLRQIGTPRSNLVLYDPDGAALPHNICALLLTRRIEQLAWKKAVLHHISMRYRS